MNNPINAGAVFETFRELAQELTPKRSPDVASWVYADPDETMFVRVEFVRSDSMAYDFRVQIFDRTGFVED